MRLKSNHCGAKQRIFTSAIQHPSPANTNILVIELLYINQLCRFNQKDAPHFLVQVLASVHVAGSKNRGHNQDDEGYNAVKYDLKISKRALMIFMPHEHSYEYEKRSVVFA